MLNDVRSIEIEIQSKCNRKCPWCPNVEFLRNEKMIMPEKTYLKLLKDLRDNGFEGVISYSRYNEPMLDIELLKLRTKQAKEILPNVKLVTNTNGDFLTKENLSGLYIDELSIMDYDCKGLEFCFDQYIKLGIRFEHISPRYLYGKIDNMKLVYCANWPQYAKLEDRGGSLNDDIKLKDVKLNWKNNKEPRTVPCYEPTYFIAIDYNGNVMPCCHLRSDNPKHEEYILGNINEDSIVDIYWGEKAFNFRKIINSDNYENYFNCCKNCQKEPGRYTRKNPGIDF